MRCLPCLLVLIGLASSTPDRPSAEQAPADKVPVVKNDPTDSVITDHIRKQLRRANVVGQAPGPVGNLRQGLAAVRQVVEEKVVAMAEADGWFYYATVLARDAQTGKPRLFVSGYAIRRDGRDVIRWDAW